MAAANVLCVNRTDTTSESGAKSLSFNTQVNPSTVGYSPAGNNTFFVRIYTYTTNNFTAVSLVDEGVVAAAIVQQLTVNARIQEVLHFCVGTSDAATSNDCADISGTTVDLGVVDTGAVSLSPVATTSGGNNVNGLAMVRTNAFNGVVIQYFTQQNVSSGKLKVAGATCSGTSLTDQCFNSAPATQTAGATGAVVAGTEKFGMTISSIDTTNGTTTNLQRDAEYDGDAATGGTCNTGTGANCWTWNETTTPATVASSAGSSVKVVDDEMIVIRYAAANSVTTPTGQYTVTSTFIATPTY